MGIKNDNNSKKIEEKKGDESQRPEIIIPTDSNESQITELTDTLKRLQAEFENYKKRIEKENANNIKNANAGLIRELLPVMDSFELALKENNCENPETIKYRKGLELIYSQLYSILEDHGLRIIDTKNQKFDPYKHEVLMVKESQEADDKILQEFQKGYFLNDTIIRHSKVMISKHG
ncbi:MAG: nucleotide exchange factor GrpE, partial [Candidatus Woesearchaeota archaeon]